VVQQQFSPGIAPSGQAQAVVLGLEKDVAALGTGQFQGDVEQGEQDFIQHARGIQLARRLEKNRQFLEVGDLIRDLDPGDLAKEIARRIGGDVLGMEDSVDRVASTKFQAVVAFKHPALDALPVYERTVLAALILDKKAAVFRNDQGVIARDPG